MVFQLNRAAWGGAYWAFFMAIILFTNYSSALDPTWRSISVSLVPALLVGLQQSYYFVNPKASILLASSFLTFVYMSFLQMNDNIKESMKDPNSDRVTSGISYASVAVFFGISFVIASRFSSGGYKNS
jgi:hypothetical protein